VFEISCPCTIHLDLDMNVLGYCDARNQIPPHAGVPYYRLFGLNSVFSGCTFWQTKEDGIVTSFSVFLPFYRHKIHITYKPMITVAGHVESVMMQIEDENSAHLTQTTNNDHLTVEKSILKKQLTTKILQQQNLLNLVSHQLQRPLALIQGYADLFFETPDEAYKDIITKEITHASFLISQLLRYGQVDAGKKELILKRRDLKPFLSDVFETTMRNAAHPNTLHYPGDAFVVCRFDEFELGECIRTLLENAQKYIPETCHIHCGINILEHTVEILVEDNGPGIPENIREFLWDPFGRPEHNVSTAGFGLGLPLSRKIVELHGGKIRCESEMNVGTRFVITLPRIHPSG
jgi:signal transduction histidine kinase